jgi:hypothetical protein
MPAKSEAQRKFIYATKGAKFAKAHHFDNKGKLPARVSKAPKSKRKR